MAIALERLEFLNSLIYCGIEPLSIGLTTPGLVVLDFQETVDRELRMFRIKLLLQTIWNIRSVTVGNSLPPLIVVLDEAQHLSWGADSMAVRILNEGRKYNLAGWFSSQWLDKEGSADAIGQADLRAYFRPEAKNAEKLARLFSPSGKDLPQYRKLIKSLQVGQFLWQRPGGQCVRVTVPQ